jgi:hypothetical protein
MQNRYQQLLELPLAVTGAEQKDLPIESSTITFRTLAGITRRFRATVETTPRGLALAASVDRPSLRRLRIHR